MVSDGQATLSTACMRHEPIEWAKAHRAPSKAEDTLIAAGTAIGEEAPERSLFQVASMTCSMGFRNSGGYLLGVLITRESYYLGFYIRGPKP